VDEHILGGQLVYDAEGFGIFGIGSCKTVENEYLTVLEIGDDLLVESVKALLGDGAVYLAPGYLVVNALAVNDKLVVGAAAGVFAGLYNESAGVGEGALATAKSVLSELCGCEIAIYSAGIYDAQLFKSVSFHLKKPPETK
jgi:hypothetical protein